MSWTKTPPTEPGWYYYNEMEECIPIEVWKDMSGRLSVGNGDNIKKVKDCLGEWGGRVPAPGTTWTVEEIKTWLFTLTDWDAEQAAEHIADSQSGIAATTERHRKDGKNEY